VSSPPSILGRLLRTQLLWSLLSGLAVAAAGVFALHHEMDELLDDTLHSAARGLIQPLVQYMPTSPLPAPQAAQAASAEHRFIWQVVRHQANAAVLNVSQGAPAEPLMAVPMAGFADTPGWRVFGVALEPGGRMLYVAQARGERLEAQIDLGTTVLLAIAPVAVLALLWLRGRIRRELQPLQTLTARLDSYDPLLPGATLGLAELAELRSVQAAIDALAARLARRVTHERAFAAHAAHALRTPLAGIDAQLAVAVREAAPGQQQRLQRVRAAASRLQRVVVALLAMFRRGFEVQRAQLDVPLWAARLPLEGLALNVAASCAVDADADLVTAAMLNLLDNAMQHGAAKVEISTPAPNRLRLHDDGPGVSVERRQALRQALETQDYEGRTGLGLMLADLVARAHGGRLCLPDVPHGFAAELQLHPG
jgi:signal transduction histidine kinase